MKQPATPDQVPQQPAAAFFQYKKILLVVGSLFILIAGGLFAWEQKLMEEQALSLAQENHERGASFLSEIRLQTASWSKTLATDLNKTNKTDALAKRQQCLRFWAGAKICLLDKDGKLISDSKPSVSGTPPLHQELFEDALINNGDILTLRHQAGASGYAEGYVFLEGDMFFVTVSRPLEGSVETSIVAVPLDARMLKQMRSIAKAHFAFLSPDEMNRLAHNLGIRTLPDNGLFFANGNILADVTSPGVRSSLQHPVPSEKTSFALFALKKADGVSAAGLLCIPLFPPPHSPAYPVSGGALGVGILLMLWGVFSKSARSEPSAAWLHKTYPRRRAEDRRLEESVNTQMMDAARIEETHNLIHSMMQQTAEQNGRDYQRFFDNSPLGIFQCGIDGKILAINQTFAAMLGYDSAVQMLTERENISECFRNPDDAFQALTNLKEQPSLRHPVTMRLHDARCRAFWMVSIMSSYKGDKVASIDGFLMDRTQEKQLEECFAQREQTMRSHQSLALLLASTCRQSHTFCSVPGAIPGQTDGKERRRGTISLQGILDDIGQIALTEADTNVEFASPIELEPLLHGVQTQVLPALRHHNVEFAYTINLLQASHLHGFAPILRHALLRSILLLTDNIYGGKANITVTQDTENPIPNTARIFFTISWEQQEEQQQTNQLGNYADASSETPAAADAASVRAGLSRREELRIIQYLAQHMYGELVEGTDTDTSRALYLTVNLSCGLNAEAPQNISAEDGLYDYTPTPKQSASNLVTEETPITEFNLMHNPDTSSGLDLLLVEDNAISQEQIGEQMQETPSRGLDILLVEDSLNNRLLFSLYLRDTPHRITEAENGEEGVELFRQKHFDVIFMDMEMPLMDGYQATRIIRAFEADTGRTPVPVVAQTAHVLPEFKNQCMLAGCTEFLSKPFSKNALHVMLAAFAENKK